MCGHPADLAARRGVVQLRGSDTVQDDSWVPREGRGSSLPGECVDVVAVVQQVPGGLDRSERLRETDKYARPG